MAKSKLQHMVSWLHNATTKDQVRKLLKRFKTPYDEDYYFEWESLALVMELGGEPNWYDILNLDAESLERYNFVREAENGEVDYTLLEAYRHSHKTEKFEDTFNIMVLGETVGSSDSGTSSDDIFIINLNTRIVYRFVYEQWHDGDGHAVYYSGEEKF